MKWNRPMHRRAARCAAAILETIANFSKPLLAAVNGYALGAGCEMVMHADITIAGSGAKFGQPEINLGTIPGAGGTQRLIRTVGKPLAMKMVLSGEFLSADEALRAGLITEVTADDQALERTLALAVTIAGKSPLAVRVAKEAMLKSFETGLEAGLKSGAQSLFTDGRQCRPARRDCRLQGKNGRRCSAVAEFCCPLLPASCKPELFAIPAFFIASLTFLRHSAA